MLSCSCRASSAALRKPRPHSRPLLKPLPQKMLHPQPLFKPLPQALPHPQPLLELLSQALPTAPATSTAILKSFPVLALPHPQPFPNPCHSPYHIHSPFFIHSLPQTPSHPCLATSTAPSPTPSSAPYPSQEEVKSRISSVSLVVFCHSLRNVLQKFSLFDSK